jgi:DNA-binding IclR family transcriptional regulator
MAEPVAIRSRSPVEATVQQQILRVLAQHPAGLTAGDIASQLALTTSVTALLRAMAQAGRVRRVTSEGYAIS